MAPNALSRTRISHHQLRIAIVWLSMALLTAPAQSAAYVLPRSVGGALPAPLLFNELLNAGAANEDSSVYGQQVRPAKPVPLAPNYFVNKWPGLRDLLLTADYDDANALESNEQLNLRLLARLRKLSDNANAPNDIEQDTLTAMPAKKYSGVKLVSSIKEHNAKKNAQYMSPCHFKICNMGRKRNADSFVSV